MSEIDEADLVQLVFSNDQGKKLIDYWDEVYIQKTSYHPDNAEGQMAFIEGQRSIILGIKFLLNQPRKQK